MRLCSSISLLLLYYLKFFQYTDCHALKVKRFVILINLSIKIIFVVVQYSFFLLISVYVRIQQIKINTIAIIFIFSLNSIENVEQILDWMSNRPINIRRWAICNKSESWNSSIARFESIKSAQMWWVPYWSSCIWT